MVSTYWRTHAKKMQVRQIQSVMFVSGEFTYCDLCGYPCWPNSMRHDSGCIGGWT